MNRGASRPSEPEEADGDQEGAEHGGLKADFGTQTTVGVELGFDVFVGVPEEGGHDYEGAQEDTQEGETFGAKGEMVDV